jgi:tetratricopeptide (TPR) repeat protein
MLTKRPAAVRLAAWALGALLVIPLPASARSPDTELFRTCFGGVPDVGIGACNELIRRGQLHGHDLARVYSQRGHWRSRKGDMDGAIADATRAIDLDPRFAVAYNNRCFALIIKGETDRAIADCTRAIDLDPRFAIAYSNRGAAWQKKREFDRAIADFNEAIRLKPTFAYCYYQRGDAWRAKRDRDAAIRDYSEAIRLDPKTADAYFGRAAMRWEKGDFDGALADLRRNLQLKPANPFAHRLVGQILHEKNDLEGAIRELIEAIRLKPDYALAYRARGWAWTAKGDRDAAIRDYDEAIRLYGEAIRLNPRSADDYFGRAWTRHERGDNDGALADYRIFLQLQPATPVAHCNVGMILRATGDLEAALREFSEAIRLDRQYIQSYTQRGLVYERQNALDLARADYESALALTPLNSSQRRAQSTAKARLAELGSVPPAPVAKPSGDGPKIALVIGNGAYRQPLPTLDNPVNDAREMAKTLRELGYDVVDGTDLDRAAMVNAIVAFESKALSAKLAVLFYSGHGVELGSHNYLMPIDAGMPTQATAPFKLVNVDDILSGLEDEAGARANIIFLDACRDNPLLSRPAERAASRGGGLAQVVAGSGTLIAFATSPGKVARDGTGSNSPFTTSLLKHVRTPDLEVRQMMTRVRNDVFLMTNKKQLPWDNSALFGEVFLAGRKQSAAQ